MSQRLLCPQCGGDYMAVVGTRYQVRDREDGDAMEVEVETRDGFGLHIAKQKSDYVDGRRDNLYAFLACEYCTDREFVLHIQNHKGQVFFEWVEMDADVKIEE